MPSPFPGMNPYLEQRDVWHDFHQQFCLVCRQMLVSQVSPRYIAKLGWNDYVHQLSDDERSHSPFGADHERESFIEIRASATRELFTLIEILSPAVKSPGRDRDLFLQKRMYARGDANYVEIDLLRGGLRSLTAGAPPCDGCVVVSRLNALPTIELWPFRIRDRLPVIPVPLSGSETAVLDLQAAVMTSIDAGGYESYIYNGEPELPLSEADAKWADQILRAAGVGGRGRPGS